MDRLSNSLLLKPLVSDDALEFMFLVKVWVLTYDDKCVIHN